MSTPHTQEIEQEAGSSLFFHKAEELAHAFAATAAARDEQGGTAKTERDLLRASGLLTMSIEKKWGGGGAHWPDVLKVVRILASADSSMAHLFGFQHLILASIDLFGNEEQKKHYHHQTVLQRWFWGNALNSRDRNTHAVFDGTSYLINGKKSFCSGATDSDMLLISVLEGEKQLIGLTDSLRPGIRIHQDWNNFGQRQTDSGTVEFNNLRLLPHEFLTTPGPLGSVRASLRPCLSQLILSNIYLGIAEGALKEAKAYTQEKSAGLPQDDPYVLAHYGNMWLNLEASRVLTDRAAQAFQNAWLQGEALTEQVRGQIALDIAASKVHTTRTGLDICNRMFEVMGARATNGTQRLDRYWRNVRTHTLHDPVDNKIKELGEWALHDRIPAPSFYS